MANTIEYIIHLPTEGQNLRVNGREMNLPEFSVSSSSSPRGALTRSVSRVAGQDTGLAMDILDRKLCGAEKYVYAVPGVESADGQSLNEDETRLAREMALAVNIVESRGYGNNPAIFLGLASFLLSKYDGQRSLVGQTD